MAIEINKGIEPFEDHIDFSRNNPDRKPWGKGSADRIDLRSEYDPAPPPPETPAEKKDEPPPAPKFTHKLSNGTVLEAASVEELASKIEQAISQTQLPPPPQDFEDKPLYVPYEFKPKELTLQEQAEILNLWKENPQAAMRKLQEADLGAPAATIIKMFQDTQQVVRQKLEEEAGVDFIIDHADTYNATAANAKKLIEFLKKESKPITRQNLAVAFNRLVAAGDKNLLRKEEPAVSVEEDESVEDVPPPPVIVPSNQGRPETSPAGSVDVAKFAALPLNEQKAFFANLKRRA